MPANQGDVKTAISNPAKILFAYMRCSGITDAKILADDLGIPIRTIQRLKLECATSANDAKCAISGASETPNAPNAPDMALPKTPDMAFSASEPSRAHATKESPTEISFTNVVKLASSREDLSETMITDIIGWMHGGDRLSAQNWLASTVKTFGQEATASGYHKLKTDLATGSVISRKLQAWSEIARRYKAKPEAPPQANYRSTPALDQTASIFEKIRAEAANAAG